jgi:holin-like protein
VGEVLHHYIPVPIPAAVYGLVIMFALLSSGALKLKYVEKTADFFIVVMPIVFVPSLVALMDIAGEISHSLLAIMLVLVVTTVVVMAATGLTADFIIEAKERRAADAGRKAKGKGK